MWSTKDIDIDIKDIIDDIPTQMLEEELATRKKLEKSDPEKAKHNEKCRHKNILYPIDPEDYDLVSNEAVTLANFDSSEMIYELEHSGYRVLPKDDMRLIGEKSMSDIAEYIQKLQPWKLKDFLCDFLGISHLSNKEQIINELKTRF